MPGVPGRSGRPKSTKTASKHDGRPESPRALTEAARKHFEWLLQRLDVDAKGSPWCKIDGATLATLAELMEDAESIATALSKDPGNDKLMRLRVQIADRVFKFSAIVGCTPRDRERLPKAEPQTDDADEWSDE